MVHLLPLTINWIVTTEGRENGEMSAEIMVINFHQYISILCFLVHITDFLITKLNLIIFDAYLSSTNYGK